MRRAAAAAAVLASRSSNSGTAAGPRCWLDITGNTTASKQLTGQQSAVHQAFLGWGQGQELRLAVQEPDDDVRPRADVPPGARSAGPEQTEAITPACDRRRPRRLVLIALNAAIGEFRKLVYVRPMAEMNNPINLYSYERKHDAAHSAALRTRRVLPHLRPCSTAVPKAQVNAPAESAGAPPVAQDLVVQPVSEPPARDLEPPGGVEHGAKSGLAVLPG